MIRKAIKKDGDELLRMRRKLFDDYSKEELSVEIEENFMGSSHPYFKDIITYVYERVNGSLGGFIDISLIDVKKVDDYNLYPKLCSKGNLLSSVPRIEAWYVDEDIRGRKIGKELVSKGEKWAINNGYNLILSDTDTHRKVSILAHNIMGYKTVAIVQSKKLVLFLKFLK